MTVQSDIQEIINDRELMQAFSGKRILVTGASGLIGSMLIRTLDRTNREYGLDIKIIGHARSEQKVRSILGNVADNISMVYSDDFNISVDCDHIIHTASPTRSKFFVECPVETIDTILRSTKYTLEIAKKNNAVFVYLSSMEEYGVPYEAGQLMTEDKVGAIDHLTPRSSYPEGKRMCECMCAAYASEYGVDVKIVRLAQTFGAGIPLSDSRVSMQFARSVVEGKNIVLHTKGMSVSNFCYLSDAIAGILIVAIRGEKGEAYNVCNDAETRSIYEIAKLVADEVANGKIEVVRDIPEGTDFGYAPDNTMRLCSDKIRKLGWEPKVGMADGYKRLIKYIDEQGWSNSK